MTRTEAPTKAAPAWERRQFRAPRGDGGLLVHPADAAPETLLRENRELLDDCHVPVCEETLATLRVRCRREILRAACDYTARLRPVRPDLPDPDRDLVVTGHQPGLHHPGVWLKNFAASAIAQSVGGVALNVVVDSDLCQNLDLTTLGGTPDDPRKVTVPLDSCSRPSPWEDVRLQCPYAFAEAGEKLTEAARPFGYTPLAAEAWRHVGPVDSSDSVVDLLTRMRHRQEREWGVELLEVPLRHVCRLPCFAVFVCEVTGNLPSLQEAYNGGLATYRRLNGIRGDSHPMPDLGRIDDPDHGTLLEAPMWVWRCGDAQRRPLYVRRGGDDLRLYDVVDGSPRQLAVLHGADCDWGGWHRLLTDLDHQGLRVRPRALMTTLFLRTCVSDLFLHGIGGAKYDEVTDHLIREWLALAAAPRFLTVSGTFRLPVDAPAAGAEDVRALDRRLRDARFKPETLLDGNPAAADLVSRKRQLIAEQHAAEAAFRRDGTRDPRSNRARYRALSETTAALRDLASAAESDLRRRRDAAAESARRAALLTSREHPWVSQPASLGELMRSSSRSLVD